MVESSKETEDTFRKKQIVVFTILSLLIGSLLFYIGNADYHSKIDNIPFAKKNTIINGTVKKTLQIKGSVKVWFNNGEIILIYAGSNENYEKTFLSNFLKQNDSISKNTIAILYLFIELITNISFY